MYRPARDAPQFRHGPPGPPPAVARPGMMNTGRPFAPPIMPGRGPMNSPPFPGGQQQHPGFGPPPPSMPPHATQVLASGRPMASAPPPGTLPPPPGTLPPPPGTLPPVMPPPGTLPPPPGSLPPPPGTLPPVLPPPGTMPSRPQPPGMVPPLAPRGPALGQALPGPPPGGPPPNLLPCVPSSPADGVPLRPAHSQVSQPHCSERQPPQPPKPSDNEMIRNIEILSQFVVKNGPEFESMARIKQAGDPKFSFLFGGDPGSDAAMGLEYFQWFKMKCQLEARTGTDGETRDQPAIPSGSCESSQQFTGPATASEVASTVPAVTDMEMDMDMEGERDDIALPIPSAEYGKNLVEGKSEIEVGKLSDQQQKGHVPSSWDSRPINDREKNLMAVSENVEASQSRLQEAKEMAFEGPCVEDLSPVRHSPKELQHTLNVVRQVSESFSISKEDPHVVGDGVPARDAIPVCHQEAFPTDPAYKPTESSSAVDAPLEIVELAEKKLGLHFAHNDMECKEIEAAKPCHDDKRLDEPNNRNSLDPDNVKCDIELHGKPDQGSVKVDKFGRLIRKGGSDSESEGAPYTFKVGKVSRSCSRSPSPGYERWRKRSRSRSPWNSSSPWRRSRWSRSHSRSPKRRRSRSRTPFRDFRRGGDGRGDRISRGRGTAPACNDFARGKCYRGVSCKFLHQEAAGDNVGRWSGAGRSRERIESRQDIRSFGGRDNSVSADVNNGKNTSTDRLSNEFDTRNVGERRNQEPYRGNDWSTPVCNNFTRGKCFRGLSCKFLHPDGTGDNVGRWPGGGRGRERIDNRQDITKPSYGKEGSVVLEVEKMKGTSPNILPNEHYRHNIRDQRSQERDRGNDRRVPACIFFARGCCQRGLSCKFLHQVSTGDNGGRWSGAERGREWKESRHDMPKSFGVGESSAVIEMDKPMNSSQDRNSDGHDSYISGKRNSLEADGHNDLWVGDKGFPIGDAFSVLRPPLTHSVREELQPPQSQTLLSEDCLPQHFHKEDIKHHALPREDLSSKPVPAEDIGACPLLHEGLYGTTPLGGKPLSHKLEENLHSGSLPKEDLQFQVKDSCPGEDLHSNPFQSLSRDTPSLTEHCLSSGQSLGPGSLPMPSHNAFQGNSHAPSYLNLVNNVDPPPPGCPAISSVMNQPVNLSGIGGSASYLDNPITAKPNSVSANTSTVIPVAFTEQRSQCPLSVSEPFNLPHLSSSGQMNLIMSMPVTSPQLSSPHMYMPAAQLPAAPLPMFGEKQTYAYSHAAGPHMPGLSAVDKSSKDFSVQGDKHDSLYVSVEPVSFGVSENLKKRLIDSAIEKDMGTKEVIVESCSAPLLENVSPHDKGVDTKAGSLSGLQDVVGNTKHKDGAPSSLKRTESVDVVQAGVKPSVVENESPVCDGKNWSPGAPLEAVAAGGGDVDVDQTHTHDESKKSKEIRMMKLFRSVLAEFVKEVLKPTWREGHMSKEAFKTIVKKVVDKVAGTLQSHQIPKTQEKIDQYVASSRLKLTKLVQGYVDKYVKS